MPSSERDRVSLSVAGVTTAALALILVQACRDEPTSVRPGAAPARPAAAVAVPIALAEATLGGISIQGALAGKLPSTDTVTSSVPAFEIKQKGSGIAGRFEITNPNSAAIALDGVNSGVGHALLAWNLGLGRGALIITSNSTNTQPTLDVSAQSAGTAADIRANNSTSTNPAVKGSTIGLGRAGDFLINNANNANVALGASTIGLGNAGNFQITNASNAATSLVAATNGTGGGGAFQIFNTANTSAALSASTTGTGAGILINHQGTTGPLATFQVAGASKIRFNRAGRGFFNGGTQTGGADVAEAFEVEGSVRSYEPGDVLVISTTNDRRVAKSNSSYSALVVGVYATKPGVLLTERDIDESLDDTVPLGVVGVIPTKVSAENGPIRRGDLLVTAKAPGHAMLGTARSRMLGATIGKALQEFHGPGTGVIKVLVNVK
jgi:hypothetical protein